MGVVNYYFGSIKNVRQFVSKKTVLFNLSQYFRGIIKLFE
ncbi:hypothetical protein HMPREF3156_02423 [Neisseria sp. HMSC06F02]|nr:hypothetical protein HMPREF3156_02423 [Neisseria sp. HMSC06F02]